MVRWPLAIERPCRLPPMPSAVMWRIEAPEGAASDAPPEEGVVDHGVPQPPASRSGGAPLERCRGRGSLCPWRQMESPPQPCIRPMVRDAGAVKFLAYFFSGRGVHDNVCSTPSVPNYLSQKWMYLELISGCI
ncbi:hypothetical protein VPH35_077782 [Triticum aestivum]